MESASCAEKIGKLCFDCKTSKTPLWRSGPAGPKSLCNACGIRFRKKRGSSDRKKLEKQQQASPASSSSTCEYYDDSSTRRKREIGDDLMAVLQRPRSPMKKVKRMFEKKKFGEVEEAAYLLMCLSCNS